jgi:hypothetical protein
MCHKINFCNTGQMSQGKLIHPAMNKLFLNRTLVNKRVQIGLDDWLSENRI